MFAIPLVIVAANGSPVTVPGALPDSNEFVALMKTGGALRANQTFALSNALVSPAAFALDKLPSTLAWWSLTPVPGRRRAGADAGAGQSGERVPALSGGHCAGRTGRGFAHRARYRQMGHAVHPAFAKQLGGWRPVIAGHAAAAETPLAALYQGRAAQREVSLQLFATNAIRKFRSGVGNRRP